MNQNINTTLAALIPVLRMNGENVVSIEAVHDWYKGQYKDANGRPREYMKEVAEITYESGGVKYADIGCDSNLTACYDVIAVIQQTKPQSAVIERIERGVYPAAQPEIIRCKDCKWKNRHNCTRAVEVFIDDDKYCAWAERRTDGSD